MKSLTQVTTNSQRNLFMTKIDFQFLSYKEISIRKYLTIMLKFFFYSLSNKINSLNLFHILILSLLIFMISFVIESYFSIIVQFLIKIWNKKQILKDLLYKLLNPDNSSLYKYIYTFSDQIISISNEYMLDKIFTIIINFYFSKLKLCLYIGNHLKLRNRYDLSRDGSISRIFADISFSYDNYFIFHFKI